VLAGFLLGRSATPARGLLLIQKLQLSRSTRGVNVAKMLVLRYCLPTMRGPFGSFTWPRSGRFECPNWDGGQRHPHGGKLHGWPWGVSPEHPPADPDLVWLVLEVDVADIAELDGGQVGLRAGDVVFSGDFPAATALIADYRQGHGLPPVRFMTRRAVLAPWESPVQQPSN